MEFLISYQLKNGKHRVINSNSKTITTMDVLPMDIHKFIVLQQSDSEATDEFLLEYLDRFDTWCDQIKDKVFPEFDYRECFSDYGAVVRVFNYYCKKNYKYHEPINPTEYKWMQGCHNGGIQYLRENDITLQSYGYDFRSFYALILKSELKIPTKAGKEQFVHNLDNLKHGYYKVNITCENDNFRKIFGFSPHNIYLNISLEIAQKYQKKYDVKINLIIDDEPNAYLYEDSDMVEMNTICKSWYNKLAYLKRKYPSNRLVKHMLSSAWGHLNAKNVINKSYDEINSMRDEGIKIGMHQDNDYMIYDHKDFDDKEYYVLLDCKLPYKYNIRLKPYVTAYGRNQIGLIAMEKIDSVIRIQTDSCVFDCEMKFDNDDLIPETKTTGKVYWKHVNSYEKIKN